MQINTVNTIINKPISEVWNYFTTASNWSKWNKGELAQAEWREGGYVAWKLTGSSPMTEYENNVEYEDITEFEHQKNVTLSGPWLDTAYRFLPCLEGTQVTIEAGNPKGGASWPDGVEALLLNAKNAWKTVVVFIIATLCTFAFAHFLAKGIGGAIGNGSAALCYALAPMIALKLSESKASKTIKSTCKALGITQRDINEAIRKIKKEQ